MTRILVYGYGNPGRQDDAAGIVLVEKLEKWIRERNLPVETDSNYQLNLEDASSASLYDVVIFADASKEGIQGFRMDELLPSDKVEFTMHAVSPSFVLHLCKEIFNRVPLSYLLHIRGYEWEFMQGMTKECEQNTDHALAYLQDFILQLLQKNTE